MSKEKKTPSTFKNAPLLWVLVSLFLIVFVYVLFFQIEWVTKEIDTGFSPAAKKNHFLAADMFLTRLGKTTHYTSQLHYLDSIKTSTESFELAEVNDQTNDQYAGFSKKDILVILDARGSLSVERYNNILSWVEAGGTLIYDVDNRFLTGAKVGDHFLEKFGLQYDSNSEFLKTRELNRIDKKTSQYTSSESETVQNEDTKDVYLEDRFFDPEYIEGSDSESYSGSESYQDFNSDPNSNNTSELDQFVEKLSNEILHNEKSQQQNFSEENINCKRLGMPSEPVLFGGAETSHHQYTILPDVRGYIEFLDKAKKPYRSAYLEERPVYLEYEQGLGRIVFGVDWNIWDNENIACGDHAYYLGALAKNAHKVWFLQNLDAPSLWDLLWSKAYIFGFFASLALLFYLWHLLVRFGPILHLENFKQRQFVEHLRAVGYLSWRSKHSVYLVHSLYKETLIKILRHSPTFLTSSVDVRRDFLVRQANISKQSAEELLQFIESHFALAERDLVALKDEVNSYKITPQHFIHIVSILKTIKARL